jgi:4-amino-4-deoxy-L-arabinose transferase-like glycosyltransferase
VAVAGVIVWQRRNIGKAMAQLASRQAKWESEEASGQQPATVAMLTAMALFAALALWTIPQVEWIGHADYAENANVARSLVGGRGLAVEYVAQFYQDRPGIAHPADTWPLLQPLLIAPFFAMFGPETWAAKLPNLFILLALAWGVFAAGSRLWDSRVGLVAGLLTLLHSYFFNSVLYPINDLAFTAIFFALAYLVYVTTDDRRPTTDDGAKKKEDGNYELRITNYESKQKSEIRVPSGRPKSEIAIGVLAGLLVWSKPSGAVLLLGLALWVGWHWWRARDAKVERRFLSGRGLLLVGGAFALVVLPLLARNLLAFGVPFYSTEGLDAWILRYWPFYEWENIYKYYVGSELPHPRWVVGGKFGYQNLFDAIGINFRWVWDKGVMGGVASSEFVIGPVALVGSVAGMVVAPRRALRLVAMALFCIGLYALFVLLYWHFEGRYFQVAIPWLYLLLAGAVVWVADAAGRLVRGAAGRVVSTVLIAVMTAGLVWGHVEAIGNFLRFDTRPTSFTVAMDWLAENSTANDVVMTRDPWELNWHSGRRAVMVPFDDLDMIRQVAQEHGVTMLQLGGPTDGIDIDACPPSADASRFPTGSRPALGKLYCGYEIPGFSLVYKNGDLTIYRLSP